MAAMQCVKDIMTRDVFAVAPDTSLETAARMLAQRRISGAPVIESGRVVGVVSTIDLVDPDTDLSAMPGYPLYYRVMDGVTEELGDDVRIRPGRVVDVMTPAVVSILEDATIVEAGARMLQLGVHRLLVVKDGAQLAGVVSTVDLLRAFVMLHS